MFTLNSFEKKIISFTTKNICLAEWWLQLFYTFIICCLTYYKITTKYYSTKLLKFDMSAQ